jgi:hypothetical protein
VSAAVVAPDVPLPAQLARVAVLSGHCLKRYRQRVSRSADEGSVRAALAAGSCNSRPAWLLRSARDAHTDAYVLTADGQAAFPVLRDGRLWVIPTALAAGLESLIGQRGGRALAMTRVHPNVGESWHLVNGRISSKQAKINQSYREAIALAKNSTVQRSFTGEIIIPVAPAMALALEIRGGRVVCQDLLTGRDATPL